MVANRRPAAMRSLPIVVIFLVLLVACGSQVSASPDGRSPAASSTAVAAASLAPSPVANPSGEPSPSPSGPPLPLVSVETRGGECADGACDSIVQVEADGRLHQLKPTDEVLAQIPPDILEAVQVEIDQANFALIESRPFTDTCPTAYDGQERVFVFYRAGAEPERIATCQVAIDPNHPLFRAVAAALSTAAP